MPCAILLLGNLGTCVTRASWNLCSLYYSWNLDPILHWGTLELMKYIHNVPLMHGCTGNFNHVTVDRDGFRLKQNTPKRVTMTITPSPNNQSPLNIQRYSTCTCMYTTVHEPMTLCSLDWLYIIFLCRCFGILLSPGKDLPQSQMNLLDNMVPDSHVTVV